MKQIGPTVAQVENFESAPQENCFWNPDATNINYIAQAGGEMNKAFYILKSFKVKNKMKQKEVDHLGHKHPTPSTFHVSNNIFFRNLAWIL